MLPLLRTLPLGVVLLATMATSAAPAYGQEAFCINCRRAWTLPGQWAGAFRMRECPLCTGYNCKDAAKDAESLKKTYKGFRDQFEELTKTIRGLRDKGTAVEDLPEDMVRQQALLDWQCNQTERRYHDLHYACPNDAKGHVWDPYGGPVPDANPPPKDITSTAGLHATQATRAAKGYGRLSDAALREFDTITGVFGLQAHNTPPKVKSALDATRARVARGYGAIAAIYQAEATRLGKVTDPPKADPAIDHTKPTELRLPKLGEVPADAFRNELQENEALNYRLTANAHLAALTEARQKYQKAIAAKDKDAAAKRGLEILLHAFLASEYGRNAGGVKHDPEVVRQKILDESLAAAAKKGLTVTVLLKQFQDGVKASGLPKHYRDALTSAGASNAELDAARGRLLALTPAAIETVLKDRRALVEGAYETSRSGGDQSFLMVEFQTVRAWYHKEVKK